MNETLVTSIEKIQVEFSIRLKFYHFDCLVTTMYYKGCHIVCPKWHPSLLRHVHWLYQVILMSRQNNFHMLLLDSIINN